MLGSLIKFGGLPRLTKAINEQTFNGNVTQIQVAQWVTTGAISEEYIKSVEIVTGILFENPKEPKSMIKEKKCLTVKKI